MKNKGFAFLILVSFLSFSFVSCAELSKISKKRRTQKVAEKWLGYDLPPSKLLLNGDVFFEGKLPGGKRFSVFYDERVFDDANFYYIILMQDFGWRKLDADTWQFVNSAYYRRYKIGYIYVNTEKEVAVYFSPPVGNYSSFKVSVK